MRHSRAILFSGILFYLSCSPGLVAAQGDLRDSFQRKLDAHPMQDTARVQILNDYAWGLKKEGSPNYLPLLVEALKISERLQYKPGIADASNQLGLLLKRNGHFAAAEKAFLRSLEMRKQLHQSMLVSSALNNLGSLNAMQGRHLEARRYYANAYQIAKQAQDSSMMATVAAQLCETHKTLGDFTASLKFGYLSLHLRTHRAEPDTLEIAKAFNTLGNVYDYMGRNELAKALYDSARVCFAATDNKPGLSAVLNNLGNVEEYSGNLDKALDHYNESYHLLMVLTDTIAATKALRNIANIYKLQTRFERARGTLLTALDLLDSTQATGPKTIARADLAELDLWEGHPRKALQQLQALSAELDSFAEPTQQMYFLYLSSLAYTGLDQYDSAFQTVQTILQRRHLVDITINAGLYEYDKFLATENRISQARHTSEKLSLEIEVAQQRAQKVRVIFAFLVLILLLGLVISLQRIRHLQQKRKAMQAKLELELKEKEIIQIQQTKENDFLRIALEVEDRERNRIATDLHDGVGAHVTALMHLLGPLRNGFGAASPAALQALNRFSTDLKSIVEEIRGVAHDLAPPTLKHFGLVPAIQGFKDLFANLNGFDFELDIHGLEERLDPKMEQHIYSILKELLSNALKNGKATAVSLQLMQIDGQLTLVVEDNGIGFDPHAPQHQHGIGLTSIHRRVAVMDGTLVIDSVIGRGTIVTIEIPNITFTP